jgi:hypothetical protein
MHIEVNGVRIDPDLIRAQAAMLRQRARDAGFEVTPDEGLQLMEEATTFIVNGELFDQEAARQGLTVDNMFDVWCKSVRPPRTKDLRDAYVQNRELFWAPAAILVSHIVKNVNHEDERDSKRAEMEHVLQLLESGADFAAVADAHSDCPGAGGRLGYIHEGEMVPEFEAVVFTAPLGQRTPIFSTRFGFHIALVSASRAEGILPFEEVAKRLEELFITEKRNAIISAHIERLRAKADIRQVSAL